MRAEATWFDVPIQIGTGGGVSSMYHRPAFQSDVVVSTADSTKRLIPDIAAVADGVTGTQIVTTSEDGSEFRWGTGGGTSLSAPIWAGLTALMNEYLTTHGGEAIRDLNPLLYRVAKSGTRPAFHDVTLGGNSVYSAGKGYDLVTGLGTPDTDALVHEILDIQRGGR